jgi:Ribosomal protein L11 methylase
MDKPMSNFHFKFMSFGYKFRDCFLPRKNILKEVGIKPGFDVLDYGCGPGGYIIAAAELVGKSGKIYAVDIHPLAIQRVQNIASKKQIQMLTIIKLTKELLQTIKKCGNLRIILRFGLNFLQEN